LLFCNLEFNAGALSGRLPLVQREGDIKGQCNGKSFVIIYPERAAHRASPSVRSVPSGAPNAGSSSDIQQLVGRSFSAPASTNDRTAPNAILAEAHLLTAEMSGELRHHDDGVSIVANVWDNPVFEWMDAIVPLVGSLSRLVNPREVVI
jgi:hypothetical protein